MSTFAGSYIKEPGDLLVVATEDQIILALCDGQQVTAKKFDDLSPQELAIIVRVANELIPAAESTINSAARKRGYAIPLGPVVDADIIEIAAQLVWISALQRGGTLSIVDANKLRNDLRDGVLKDIADGDLVLTAIFDTATEAPGSLVHSITDAASRDTTGSVERVSRAQWSRF